MTREEFIAGYCARSGIAWEVLAERRIAVPCECGAEQCLGWCMVPKDFDAFDIALATGRPLAAVNAFLSNRPANVLD